MLLLEQDIRHFSINPFFFFFLIQKNNNGVQSLDFISQNDILNFDPLPISSNYLYSPLPADSLPSLIITLNMASPN